MCIGIPMQIIESGDFIARCRGRNGDEEINMLLIGPQPEGTWILNFLGSAREVLTEEEAANANSALDALELSINGEGNIDIDRYFPGISSGS